MSTDKFIVIKEEEVELNFYTVRSKDGKWLRAKKHGYNSLDTGKSWTDNITEARIYTTPRGAKGQVTFWARNYPQFGVPDLVQITTGKCLYLDQEERTKKVIRKREIENAEREIDSCKYYLDTHLAKVKALRGDGKDNETLRLRRNLKSAQEKLEKLKAMK